jgi:hypothetical protein
VEEQTSGEIGHYRLLPVSTNFDSTRTPVLETLPFFPTDIAPDGSCQGKN